MALAQVPQIGQNLGNTQQPILDNFQIINDKFNVDHVEFSTGVDSGKHKKITFPVLYSTTGTMPVFGVDERGLFAAQTTMTGKNEIFVWKSASFGGGLGSQRFSITQNRGNNPAENAESYAPATNNMANTSGYAMLPNGTFMQWCIVDTGTSSAVTQFNWPIAFVGYVFNIQLTQVSNGVSGVGFGEGRLSLGMSNVLQEFRIQQKDTISRRYMVLGIGTRYV